MRTAEARARAAGERAARRRAASGGAGRRDGGGARSRRLRAARPRDRRPDRRAGARAGCCPGSSRRRRRRSRPARWAARSRAAAPRRSRSRAAREIGERVAAAMVAAYRDAGIASEARVAPVDRAGARLIDEPSERRRMKFGRPAGQLAGLRRLRQRDHRARSASALRRRAAGCSRSQHRPPTLSRAALSSGSTSGAASARARPLGRVALPRDRAAVGAATVVSHPGGQHSAAPPRGARPLDRRRAPAAQARGPQSDRLVQGPRDDGGRDAGRAHRRDGRGLRVDRQYLGVARGLRGAGGHSGAGARARRTRWRIGKLAQTLAYGARTLLVRGDFDDCLRLVRGGERASWASTCSTRSIRSGIEGQKTIVLEMLQQLDWEPPDWIVLPAGNLGNTAAFGKALLEAHRWGLISRLPRLAAVQAAGAAPFARSFAEDFEQRYAVQAETVATAIRIGDPASFDRAVHAIRETDGVVLAVTDEEILEAKAVVDAMRGRMRAGERRERRRRARAGAPRADGAGRACGGGAHGPHPQGSRAAAQVSPGHRAAAGGRESADRDRARAGGDRAGAGAR